MSGIRDGAAVRRRRRGAAPAGGPSPHARTAFHGKVFHVPLLVSSTDRADALTRRTRIRQRRGGQLACAPRGHGNGPRGARWTL